MQIDRPNMNINTPQIQNTAMNMPMTGAPLQSSIPMPGSMNPQQYKADMELKKQCQEFESVLITQMFKQMRPKTEEQDLFGSTKDREMFNSMIDDERAKVWAQQGGIGLASIMFEQMKDTGKKQ